ncbi:MAG: 23S rRNA (guanosine(2251)-2'-O)-methyltransferase RlmB [Flavobacteriales bacterium]|nr:MAG: 23S rRNA (guanosine(2251)-2'-O)-methyltransferase RlmB [Flavobacteriales bacterium]
MVQKKSTIFGIRPVIEALRAGQSFDKILARKGLKGELFTELKSTAAQHKIQLQLVPIEKLNRITRKNHQGVVAFLSPIAFAAIETLLPYLFEKGEMPLILILDRISDVRNFGAIARAAECAGAHALVIPLKDSAQINEDAVKASAGALFNIPVCREKSLAKIIGFLQNSGVQIVCCTEKGNDDFYTADFDLPTAIVIGSEQDGISAELIKKADRLIKIPLKGKTESLNVSVAAGIVLFETVRQRA